MKQWTTEDKSNYELRGPWDREPDKVHWVHNGLDCLIVRGPLGALCGYVGIPEGHPMFGHDEVDVDVHGGLTFAGRCRPTKDDARGVCHPKEGAANEIVWWLGFDCAHIWDVMPKYKALSFQDGSYKDLAYVKAEVERLAEQL